MTSDEEFLNMICDTFADHDCDNCLACKIYHIAASTLNSVGVELGYAVKQIKEAIMEVKVNEQ